MIYQAIINTSDFKRLETNDNKTCIMFNLKPADEEGKSTVNMIYTYTEVTEESALELVKKAILSDIKQYDQSSIVNQFFIVSGENRISTWLSKNDRVGLMNSSSILKAANIETTALWLGNTKFILPCQLVIDMLGALEIYALQCYDVTSMHIANVSNINSWTDLEEYNYKAGYPEAPVFTL